MWNAWFPSLYWRLGDPNDRFEIVSTMFDDREVSITCYGPVRKLPYHVQFQLDDGEAAKMQDMSLREVLESLPEGDLIEVYEQIVVPILAEVGLTVRE
jgi:hypothetical protein